MMSAQNDHQLDQLVRAVNPDTFSEKAQGQGYLLKLDIKTKKVAEKPGLLKRLIKNKRDVSHYFVKSLGKPLMVKGWDFRWSEGASDVELDLKATFEIGLEDKIHAERLIEALHHPDGPTSALYDYIDKHLHLVMRDVFQSHASENTNLLAEFYSSRLGSGESQRVNKLVSLAVARELGGTYFRIGFKLDNMPPMQVEINDHSTQFTVSDSKNTHHVNTNALLELSHYQNYKNAGSPSIEDIESSIKESVDAAVNRYLFGKPYYEIVQYFDHEDNNKSIEKGIKGHIEHDAAQIGYEVKMFQTLPDIDALSLLSGLRVDLSADDYEFRPRNSTGYVKMDVSIEVKAHNFKKMQLLIEPDAHNIPAVLRDKLAQICRDEIQKIDRMKFNLGFGELDGHVDSENTVISQLITAFKNVFETRYGLKVVSIINISQSQTEEGERFANIRRQATDFDLNITPQADIGKSDALSIKGCFEVMDIVAENGWEKFENKDFGYRKDSLVWESFHLSDLPDDVVEKFGSLSESEIEKKRKSIAVYLELREIRRRIEVILEEELSKVPHIADRSRGLGQMSQLREFSETVVIPLIKDEFGLAIAIREFKRLDTDTEITHAQMRETKHELLRKQAKQDGQQELDITGLNQGLEKSLLTELHNRKLDLLGRGSDDEIAAEERKKIDEEIEKITANNKRQLLDTSSAKDLLDSAETNEKSGDLGDDLINLAKRLSSDDGKPRLKHDEDL